MRASLLGVEMIKISGFAALFLSVFLTSAYATDAPVPMAADPQADPQLPPETELTTTYIADLSDWTGWYVSGQLGAGNGELLLSAPVAFPRPGLPWGGSPSGAFAGVGATASYQLDSFVLSLDTAFLAGDMSERRTDLPAPNYFDIHIRDVFTIGPRLGVAVDEWQFFVEAGFASAEIGLDMNSDGFDYTMKSKRSNGTYIGLGLEYAINENWYFGAEYNHVELNDVTLNGHRTLNLAFPAAVDVSDIRFDTIVAKIIYKFD